jgi:hypothetical protein
MKQYIFYPAIFFILIFSVTSCDDYLDQVPDDILTIEQVFQRKRYSEDFLANIYSYVPDESHRTSPVPWDPCSDDLDVTYDRSGYNSYKMNFGNWDASSDYYNFWDDYYSGIRAATYFMQHIGDNKELLSTAIGRSLIKQYIGEARFLRAFFYYGLIRQYGPCIVIGDEMISPDLGITAPEMNLARNTYDESVAYIINELDLAQQELPYAHFSDGQPENEYGRATKVMCMALKSRVLLLAASPQFNGNTKYYSQFTNADGTHLINQVYDNKKWEKAALAANELIQYAGQSGKISLYRKSNSSGVYDPYLSCRDVFLEPWNSEVLFSRNTNSLQHWERSCISRISNGYESMGVTQQLVDEFETATGKRINDPDTDYKETGFTTSRTAFAAPGTSNMYINREPRFYVNVQFNGRYNSNGDSTAVIQLFFTGNSGRSGTWDFPRTGYIAYKNVHPSSNPFTSTYIKRPYLIMRYAEILLNFAEAVNEYGGPTYTIDGKDAYWAINAIRDRAGLPPLPAGLTKPEMRERIRHERRVELCMEQLRYFDTRRWLIAEETDGGPFYGMNVSGGTSLSDPVFHQRVVFETRVFRKSFYLFPIPQSEINKNKNIVQNPFW